MDPRETPSNGRVAHVSLEGKVEADRFVEGDLRHVGRPPCATLWRKPTGVKDRELLFGDAFRVLETRDGVSYGISVKDAYVGYLEADTLVDVSAPPTHRVSARLTLAFAKPDVKADEHIPLSFGSPVLVEEEGEFWCTIVTDGGRRHVPRVHLRPLDAPLADPAAIAERFLHTPYLWGGNTSFGIDCSGLVQAALLACGIACPGDSDQQEIGIGQGRPTNTPLERNDLVFWKGHVAIALDKVRVIHANAHHMAVAIEPFETARARIAANGGGEVTSLRRP